MDCVLVRLRNRDCLALVEVDQDQRLRCSHHQLVVAGTVGRQLVGHARPPDPRHADVHLDQVVEDRRSQVLDVAGTHDELLALFADVHAEQAEVTVVLDPCQVEIGQVTAVVNDSLCVGVREADPCLCAELEGRLLLHVRITSRTSSRLRSINSGESASRLRRSRGSVFDGRTFMCHCSASTDRPSRCETLPSGPNRSLSSCSFKATSSTGVLSSPVMKYCSL